jgi:hypothetical protein
MKKRYFRQFVFILISTTAMSSLSGCDTRERVTTYDVTKTGKNWVESESIQRYRAPNGKVTVDKQNIYEKINCIGRRGKKIDAATPDECIERGGKIVDEVYIEEESTSTKTSR